MFQWFLHCLNIKRQERKLYCQMFNLVGRRKGSKARRIKPLKSLAHQSLVRSSNIVIRISLICDVMLAWTHIVLKLFKDLWLYRTGVWKYSFSTTDSWQYWKVSYHSLLSTYKAFSQYMCSSKWFYRLACVCSHAPLISSRWIFLRWSRNLDSLSSVCFQRVAQWYVRYIDELEEPGKYGNMLQFFFDCSYNTIKFFLCLNYFMKHLILQRRSFQREWQPERFPKDPIRIHVQKIVLKPIDSFCWERINGSINPQAYRVYKNIVWSYVRQIRIAFFTRLKLFIKMFFENNLFIPNRLIVFINKFIWQGLAERMVADKESEARG